eukprot:4065379-Amphidinium_carterae.1
MFLPVAVQDMTNPGIAHPSKNAPKVRKSNKIEQCSFQGLRFQGSVSAHFVWLNPKKEFAQRLSLLQLGFRQRPAIEGTDFDRRN